MLQFKSYTDWCNSNITQHVYFKQVKATLTPVCKCNLVKRRGEGTVLMLVWGTKCNLVHSRECPGLGPVILLLYLTERCKIAPAGNYSIWLKTFSYQSGPCVFFFIHDDLSYTQIWLSTADLLGNINAWYIHITWNYEGLELGLGLKIISVTNYRLRLNNLTG